MTAFSTGCYGWSGDNPYVISSDGTHLIYDNVMFNAAAISQVYGTFTENIVSVRRSTYLAWVAELLKFGSYGLRVQR